MKEITSNKKYVLSLVDPDEVFDILGKSDGKGLFCRCIKGKYQAATHELKYLKVADIKNYIEDAKNNDPNEFIIFYRVAEKTTKVYYAGSSNYRTTIKPISRWSSRSDCDVDEK